MVRKITKSGLTRRVGETAKVLTYFNGKRKWFEGEVVVTKKYPKAYAIRCDENQIVPLVEGSTRIGFEINRQPNTRRRLTYTQYFEFV